MGEEENKKQKGCRGWYLYPQHWEVEAETGGSLKLEASFVYTDCYKLARDT